MLIHIRRFQKPSSQYENTASLLHELSNNVERSAGIRIFSKVLSIFMAALALLVMIIFTIQTPMVTPLALYTAVFLACCILTYMAIFVVQGVLTHQSSSRLYLNTSEGRVS
ncbi:hypothetical protein BOKEGFJH_00166 [Chlamydia avium]|uniref:Uncharacterized protein n=1 Tax=Chlamydia avium 10DC88 TaxID=1229831 RepID=W8JFR5_9CHLA|nr:hypothetical protein [Chlamydia avium]AHK63040.1 Uncharacterized protein M832_01710 [Chlamydia avium 10DC88]VVT42656.1 hypothetical protein BOKEGFJH_00166 [Chlamydia avium]